MTNFEKKLQKYSKLFLILIFIFAVTLRWWFLPNKNIGFQYDQARDGFVVQQLLGGHLKLLGPPTSGTPGLFHGVLYYYLIAPAYYFGHGNPVIVAYWMAFLNALTILPVFYLTYLLTKKYAPALLASLIFAFSFDAIQFSDLLSNVSVGIFFIPCIFIGLYLWIKKEYKYAPVITGLAFGFSVQSEIAFYFYLVPILIWLLIYRKKITKKDVFLFVLSTLVAVSTMLIAELKFGFQGLKGLVYLFTSQDKTTSSKLFSDFLIIFLNQAGDRFANTIYPFNVAFGALLGFAIVAVSVASKSLNKAKEPLTWQAFLISYIPAHIIALPFGGSITPHIMIGAIPAISIFLAIFLWESFHKYKYIIFLLVVSLMLINLASFVKKNQSDNPDYFTSDYLISTEMKILDYTYQKANGKPFSISTLTSPLYINTLWSYLYNWYGREKYGYLPFYIGHDQIGQLGNNLLSPPKNVKIHFYIEEPTNGIPSIWVNYSYGDQESMSKLIEQKRFGDIIVEERILNNGK